MFNLHKNAACSMFWLRPIFPRYGNKENDQRLMFLKKRVGVQGRFSGQNQQINLPLYNLSTKFGLNNGHGRGVKSDN